MAVKVPTSNINVVINNFFFGNCSSYGGGSTNNKWGVVNKAGNKRELQTKENEYGKNGGHAYVG